MSTVRARLWKYSVSSHQIIFLFFISLAFRTRVCLLFFFANFYPFFSHFNTEIHSHFVLFAKYARRTSIDSVGTYVRERTKKKVKKIRSDAHRPNLWIYDQIKSRHNIKMWKKEYLITQKKEKKQQQKEEDNQKKNEENS